jgi:S1-C subfamily serine protease
VVVVLQVVLTAHVTVEKTCPNCNNFFLTHHTYFRYIEIMKLYSKHQVVIRSLISAVVTAAIVAVIMLAIVLPKKSASAKQHTADAAVAESAADDSASSQEGASQNGAVPNETVLPEVTLQTNTPVLPVVNETGTYTQDEAQNISVYEKCNEAVVNITTQVMGYDWFLEPVITQSGSGSGSIIDKRGYVVTNVHVIENASKISISLADGSTYDGRVVGQDKESDIAVLKFDPPSNVELKTISFGNSDTLKVGQKVIAIGNPFALERTMTTGIVSGLGRPIQESTNVIIRNMVQTDAAINPGNSGGPLLDTQGRMIGINTMIYSNSGSSSGVGFAIPVSTARRVVSDLLKYGKVNRGVINVTLVQNSSRIADYAGYSIATGMIVSQVKQGSKAASAGIKGGTQQVQYGSSYNAQTIYLGGDIITAIDSIKVSGLADYYSALEDKRPGDKVMVTIWRKGEYKKLSVTLEGEDTTSGDGSTI